MVPGGVVLRVFMLSQLKTDEGYTGQSGPGRPSCRLPVRFAVLVASAVVEAQPRPKER